MKRLFTVVPLFMALFLSSFTFRMGIDEVIAGIQTGNAAQVAKFFDNNVEITMPDKSNSYSKSQAELILKDFFAMDIVKSFEVLHKGDNAGSQYYCIGRLVTKGGVYRTTIYMRQKGDQQVLQELRFENH